MFDEIRRFGSSAQEDFYDLLKVYDNNFEGESKTNTEEIVYWLDNKSDFRELLIFGGYVDNKPVGYLQISYYKAENFACIDYAACENGYRGLTMFNQTILFTIDYIKANYEAVNYIVAEVIKEEGTAFIRLMRRLKFMFAEADYRHPSLHPKETNNVLEANLLIYSYDRGNSIPKKKYTNLIIAMFQHSFVEWQIPFLNALELESYKVSIDQTLNLIIENIGINEDIQLI